MIIIMITTTTTTTIIILIIMMMMTIIIIVLKGAVRDFLQSSHCAANYLQHARSCARAQLCANHVQHTERLFRATCRVPRGPEGQLSY